MPTRYVTLLPALFGALVLSSCAPATPDWSKPGVSAGQAARDWNQCRRNAEHTSGGRQYRDTMGPSNNALDIQDRTKIMKDYKEITESCMRSKGYGRGASK